jgi:hypothetical protein
MKTGLLQRGLKWLKRLFGKPDGPADPYVYAPVSTKPKSPNSRSAAAVAELPEQ